MWIFLAHQDDEVFLWPVWSKILEATKIYIIFTTNGELSFTSKSNNRIIRNSEAIQNLTSNGIRKENIFFLSNKLPGNDTILHHHASYILNSIYSLTNNLSKPDCIVFPGCEGGHPDHDVTNLIVKIFVKKYFTMANCYEFFLYALSNHFPKYNIARPELIATDTLKIIFFRKEIFKVIKTFLNYRSQYKTFILLGPALIICWLIRPIIYLKKVNLDNVNFVRPDNGHILYEKRKWTTFDEIKKKLEKIKQN